MNFSIAVSFAPAVATWYRSAGGGGSGGACGFEDNLKNTPFHGLTAAGNNNLFRSGGGCGTCYQVKCAKNAECSGSPITITITNECPGACNNEPFHFDLSEKAFKRLAKPGKSYALLNLGRIDIQYKRVACQYRSMTIVFKIDKASGKDYLAITPEFENGDGDIASAELIVSKNCEVLPMSRSYGATWATGFKSLETSAGPYSVRITTIESRRTVVAYKVIPANWVPGAVYVSKVNF